MHTIGACILMHASACKFLLCFNVLVLSSAFVDIFSAQLVQLVYVAAYYSCCRIMDEGTIPTTLLNCCICDVPETPTQKLVQPTPRGYPALSGYAEAFGNVAILDHIKETYKVGGMRYHKECKCDIKHLATLQVSTSAWKKMPRSIVHSTKIMPKHKREQMLRLLHLFSHGLRRVIL